MIIGIGTDILEVNRVQKAIDRNPKFLKKVFTENEIAHFESRNNMMTTIAGTFAVKEAVAKVLGTGIRGFNFTDIEVIRTELGKPVVTLYNGALALAESLNITKIMATISHSETYAIAYCIGVSQTETKEMK